MIQTAGGDQVLGSRHSRISNRNTSNCRNTTNGSRISTAGAGDTTKGRIEHHLQFASQNNNTNPNDLHASEELIKPANDVMIAPIDRAA